MLPTNSSLHTSNTFVSSPCELDQSSFCTIYTSYPFCHHLLCLYIANFDDNENRKALSVQRVREKRDTRREGKRATCSWSCSASVDLETRGYI
mmetsp:Transcript_10615/g.15323  ORF Transcript_10615/g.15323 Transcript_10615/m.15323 type:complete len:93 (+) Transcript_10615:792-1070(+)